MRRFYLPVNYLFRLPINTQRFHHHLFPHYTPAASPAFRFAVAPFLPHFATGAELYQTFRKLGKRFCNNFRHVPGKCRRARHLL
jgi:hypothetical protein